MKIEIKNFKFFAAGSRETNNFVCDIYADGIKIGSASNDGGGGSTMLGWDKPEQKEMYLKAEAFCQTLPDWDLGHGVSVKMNLENKVDQLVDDAINEKEKVRFKKKMERDMDKGILTGTDVEYAITHWKGWTISQMMKSEQGRAAITKAVTRLKEEGKNILNTNLPGII